MIRRISLIYYPLRQIIIQILTMRTSNKQQSNIVYKPLSKNIDPQCNQPLSNLKPLIIKQAENSSLDANMLAAMQHKKTEQMKEQQRSRMQQFLENTRLNASKISHVNSKKINQSRRIKDEIVLKQNKIKEKYTITQNSSKILEQSKSIQVQPTRIEWKSAKNIVELEKSQSKSPVFKETSKQPIKMKKQKSVDRSQITFPKYKEEEDSSEDRSEIDSETEQANAEQLLEKRSKLRQNLRKIK